MKRDALLNQGITLYFYLLLDTNRCDFDTNCNRGAYTEISQTVIQKRKFRHRGKLRDKNSVFLTIGSNLGDLTLYLTIS